jgi:hypothetical protein
MRPLAATDRPIHATTPPGGGVVVCELKRYSSSSSSRQFGAQRFLALGHLSAELKRVNLQTVEIEPELLIVN